MQKNQNLSSLGKALLGLYFVISVAGRVFALVIFFTPLLGLFNILRMAEAGMLPASKDTVYDITSRNETITMETFWSQEFRLHTVSDLFSGDSVLLMYFAIIISTLVLHCAISALILWRLLTVWSFESLCSIFHTLVCPPMFLDWEYLYRSHGKPTSIRKCWDISKFLHQGFVALFAVENLALCIPLAILKHNFDTRAAALESNHFPLLSQETHSVFMANSLLLTSVITFSIILPILQLLIARLYFR